jgi:hypothetical protein
MAKKPNKKPVTGVGTKPLITVDPSLPSFDGHPYFEKKAAVARETLKKVGLPKQLTKNANR